jgi:TPR repeat protein
MAANHREEANHYFEMIESSLGAGRTAAVSAPPDPGPVLLVRNVTGKASAANAQSAPDQHVPRSRDADAPEVASLAMQRGDELIKLGDVVAARRFYEVVASTGISRAATAVGKTFDPLYLQQAGVRGVQANPGVARQWYEKAVRAGDAEAAPLLDRISATSPLR